MINLQPFTLFPYLLVVKLGSIISDQYPRYSESVYHILPQERDHLISCDVCQCFSFHPLSEESTTTRTNCLLPVALGKGPRICIPHWQKGQGEGIFVISAEGCLDTGANL